MGAKICETCGKVLDNSMQEFRVNGILQCESCAYPDHKPIINNFNEKEYRQISNDESLYEANSKEKTSKNFWAKVLKIIGGCNVVFGIIASVVIGIAVSELIDGDISILILAVIIIVGPILSIISSALLMTFATLAEDVSVIRQIKEEINKKPSIINKKAVSKPVEEQHKCRNCGHVQRKEIKRCLECGDFIEDL